MGLNAERQMDDEAARELLGAYALDALDADELAAVEALVDRDPVAAYEADRLRSAATWIGATEALAPPPLLRRAVFDAARSRTEDVTQYRVEAARFDTLLDTIDEADLDVPTTNGLRVGELVAHLAAMESAVAEGVGAPVVIEAPMDIEARTEVFVAAFADRALTDGRSRWRASVDALAGWADAGGETGRFPWWGVDAPRRNVLMARAFELWTHADDIRVALGRPTEPPAPETLGMMSDVAVRALTDAVSFTGRAHPGRSARVVLTGGGGGEWIVPLAPTGDTDPSAHAPDVTITADVVDFCRLVGDRLAPHELGCEIEGDATLAADLLAAAPAFATL